MTMKGDAMQDDTMNKMKSVVQSLQMPLQELTELNLRTLQSFSYIKPQEWAQIHKPEEFFEKQMNVFIENGHKTLDYLQEASALLEKNWLALSQEVRKSTEQVLSQTKSTLQK